MWDLLKSPSYVDIVESELLIPHYLIHCYLYYEMGVPAIEDYAFDQLSRRLLDEWDEVEHVHKHLIDPEGLTSGGAYIKHPRRVAQAAQELLRKRPGGLETQQIGVIDPVEKDLGDLF